MGRFLRCTAVCLCLFLAAVLRGGAAADTQAAPAQTDTPLSAYEASAAGILPDSSDWTPPDLRDLGEDSPAQLRVLAVAQGQVGYQAGAGYSNKYSRWFDGSDSPWCTEFFTWCTAEADRIWGTDNSGTLFPFKGTVHECYWGFIDRNQFVGADGRNYEGEAQWIPGSDHYLEPHEYVPRPGDVMWVYLYGGKDYPDHTTLVEGTSRDASGDILVHVIEGNINSRVQRAVYPLKDPCIVGFGTPENRVYTALRLDSRFGGVNVLREDLLALGYDASPRYTQRMDERTRNAIRQFQADHGLPVTGVQDIMTREAMDAELRSAYR